MGLSRGRNDAQTMNQLSRDLGASLHHQVFNVLRSAIASGRYSDGDYLPSEEALTDSFGVSRATIRRAMLSLEQAGLIERRQGRGTRVIRPLRASPPSLSSHLDLGFADAASSMRMKDFEQVLPPEIVREALDLAAGELAWRLVRIREEASRPLWIIQNYFPAFVGEGVRHGKIARTTLFDALRRVGHPCSRAEETVGAALADPEVAAEIGVKIGAPLLELSRVMFDVRERPIAYQLTLIPPERRKLRLNIEPQDNGPPHVTALPPRAGAEG